MRASCYLYKRVSLLNDFSFCCMRIFLMQIFIVWFVLGAVGQCYIEPSEPQISGEQFIPIPLYAGSEYLIDDWSPGDVFLLSGDTVKNKLLRYNAFHDELIWFDLSNSSTVRVDKYLVSGFSIALQHSDSIAVFKKTSHCDGFLDGFLQELKGGHISLYAKHWVEKTSNIDMVYIGGKAKRAISIVPRKQYLVKTANGQCRTLSLNRRSFIKTFSDDLKTITRKSLRQNSIRFKDEQDLINAITWIEKNLANCP